MEYKDIEKAVKGMQTIPITRKNNGKTITKEYPMVTEKVKAFKSICPNGTILTELIHDDGASCVFKAIVKDGDTILGCGHAKEEKDASFINKTSYIENCETSAVGRALSFAGFGGDDSIASADELANALENQNKVDKQTAMAIMAKAQKDGVQINLLCDKYGVKRVYDLKPDQADEIVEKWSSEVVPNCRQKE